ncbi:MAG: MarR family transcriptional regulator [Thermoleophilia bacterium]|nr:MarR family transcriptional regulator [Thermoleophilia bacterium]
MSEDQWTFRRLAYGLGFTHVRMLMFLSQHAGARQEDIRSFIDADKGGVAHAVKRLVELELVERHAHPEDGRAYVIDLTQRGRELLDEVASIARAWNDQMIRGFSAAELKIAEEMLQRMADNAGALLEDEGEGPRECSRRHD